MTQIQRLGLVVILVAMFSTLMEEISGKYGLYTPWIRIIGALIGTYVFLKDFPQPKQKLNMRYREQIERAIRGGLLSTIDSHGPIDSKLVYSATKRVFGQLKGLAKNKYIRWEKKEKE